MMEDWRRIIESLYPDLGQETYCVPPVYFNRVPYTNKKVGGQSVLVTQQPLDSKPQRSALQAGKSAAAGKPVSAGKSSPKKTSRDKKASCETADEVHHPDAPPAVSPDSEKPEDHTEIPSLWTRHHLPDDVIPEAVCRGDTRDDFAQQHVLHCLHKLGTERPEGMFIVSQLNFSHYLNKASYAADAATLPRPVDLSKDIRRGDFDILLIHPRHGILIGEVKSVGLMTDELARSQEQGDKDVTKRVERAVKQLDKSDVVMKHMLSDISRDIPVKKTLILPYVSSAQLERVLKADTKLEELVCHSLGAKDAAAATQLCLCSDQLSDRNTPWDVTVSVLETLDQWFRRRMDTIDSSLTPDVYLDIVARVAGPATTVTVHCVVPPRVEVRTLGEAVSECGERLVRIVLTPAQLDLLNRAPDVVYLTGPPGTGKTLVLILIGLVWLRQGHDVHVVSTRGANLAASQLINHQLQMTLKADSSLEDDVQVGKVHLHQFELPRDADKAVQTLLAASKVGGLHVLMDEADLLGRESDFGKALYQTLTDLESNTPDLKLWAASMYRFQDLEEDKVELLTTPLRCSPTVLREVDPAVRSSFYSNRIHPYTSSSTPSPFDGPEVIHLRHHGPDHSGKWPVECEQCGADVAELLKKLRVGQQDDNISRTGTPSPPSLQYRDVIALTRSTELCDEVLDDSGNVSSSACGFVRGLRDAGIPTAVIWRQSGLSKWETAVADIAVARHDHVTVTHFVAALGLERKVVVHLPGRKHSCAGSDDDDSDELVDWVDRVLAVSRCLAQLVVVDVPKNEQQAEAHPEF